jgi:TolB protein
MSVRKHQLIALAFFCWAPFSQTQDKPQVFIRPSPQEEIILAAPDVQPLNPDRAAELSDTLRTLNQVLWDDLKFAGYFTMAGKGFYPKQPIVRPEDLNYEAWSGLPFKISYLSAGTLDLVGGILRAEFRLYDMKQHTMSFGQRISGDTDQVRSIAHRWADELVYRLTAGASRGIASTKIVYSSRRGGAKEIYVMDYDGHDQQPFTRNGSINLFPVWSPDNSKLAFVSYRTGKPEINVHSFIDGSRLPFPMFNTLALTPSFSPDGTQVAFALRAPGGDTDIFISKIDGSDRRNITNHPAIDTSPTWSPSGKQLAFISDREGAAGQVFICDADGANVRRIVKEGGDADSPSWSPDGRFIAFHWKPHLAEKYDIYIANVSSGMINQLTSNGGSNENPAWSPDGRHIAFHSDRSGTKQIYIMLVGGNAADIRMITNQGNNTSPAWGGYVRKD